MFSLQFVDVVPTKDWYDQFNAILEEKEKMCMYDDEK